MSQQETLSNEGIFSVVLSRSQDAVRFRSDPANFLELTSEFLPLVQVAVCNSFQKCQRAPSQPAQPCRRASGLMSREPGQFSQGRICPFRNL